MTDFYAILKNAVAESKADNATRRAALYARARASLNKQLELLKPPLSTAARQEQREALERAVRRIEAEAGGKSAPTERPSVTTPQPKRPETEKRGEAAAPASETAEAGAAGAPRRRGRAAMLVPLLVLLVIVAGGALAYWQWDTVGPRVTGLAEQAMSRLGMGAGEPAPGVAPEAPPTETMEDQPPAPAPAPSDGTPDTAAAEPPPAETPAEAPMAAPPAETPAPPQAEAAAEPDKDQSRVPAAALPTERAYLLVEQDPPASEDKRFAGTALWSLGGEGADTSLAVAVSFPDRSADISLVFRANTDGSLPASHTIDVIYHGPAEPDGTITNMVGLMVRSDNGETSVPLRGAGAPVVAGQFLFGLSSAPADREHNISQLKAGSWLLIPVQFESKRRSVVVIEKGASGREAMNKAFAAWEKARAPGQGQ